MQDKKRTKKKDMAKNKGRMQSTGSSRNKSAIQNMNRTQNAGRTQSKSKIQSNGKIQNKGGIQEHGQDVHEEQEAGSMQKQPLPTEFVMRMQEMLGPEFPAFMESYEKESSYGLRYNPLKADQKQFERTAGAFLLSKVPWAEEGYACKRELHPGKHVLHEAGAYYIQDPSAMSAVEALDPKPGERILDLCAAPGGKTTQIAGRLHGRGLLVSNEIVPSRARILSQNVERFGIRNCVVCNEEPSKLAEYFPCYFHRILVDAPCSGEGMFRKDENARVEWSGEQVTLCAERQLSILESADRMLMPGGMLLYATCAFAPMEDEGVIVRFLRSHPEYMLAELPLYEGMEHGRPDWVSPYGGVSDFDADTENAALHLERCLRLFPHRLAGEGHFVAGLYKGQEESFSLSYQHIGQTRQKDMLALWEQFAQESLIHAPEGVVVAFGGQLYLVPSAMRDFGHLKVERAGLHLGEYKKNRFEPAHALARALCDKDAAQSRTLSFDEAERYIRGETIAAEPGLHGWVLMCYEGYALGWGKASGGQIKNHYPKGLRIMG